MNKERYSNNFIMLICFAILIFVVIIPYLNTNTTQRKWHIVEHPIVIQYYVNIEEDIENRGEWIDAIFKAIDSWQNITEKIIKFEFKGFTSVILDMEDIDRLHRTFFNHKNTINVITKNWPLIWHEKNPLMGGSRSKPTVFWAYIVSDPKSGSFHMTECDIFINAQDYRWKTKYPYEDDEFDIQNALSHSIGHLLGLPELSGNENKNTTMYEYTLPGETVKRTIKEQDIILFKKLYSEISKIKNGIRKGKF